MPQSGIERLTVGVRLGHESVETTQIHLQANLAMKELALASVSLFEGDAKPQ